MVQTDDNFIHNRTVSDFRVKSLLVNNNAFIISKLPYSSSSSAAVAAAGHTTVSTRTAPQRHLANTHEMCVSGSDSTCCCFCFQGETPRSPIFD